VEGEIAQALVPASAGDEQVSDLRQRGEKPAAWAVRIRARSRMTLGV
jgi:hypothetical protein